MPMKAEKKDGKLVAGDSSRTAKKQLAQTSLSSIHSVPQLREVVARLCDLLGVKYQD